MRGGNTRCDTLKALRKELSKRVEVPLWLLEQNWSTALAGIDGSVATPVPRFAGLLIARRMITRSAHHAMQRRYESSPPVVVTALGC